MWLKHSPRSQDIWGSILSSATDFLGDLVSLFSKISCNTSSGCEMAVQRLARAAAKQRNKIIGYACSSLNMLLFIYHRPKWALSYTDTNPEELQQCECNYFGFTSVTHIILIYLFVRTLSQSLEYLSASQSVMCLSSQHTCDVGQDCPHFKDGEQSTEKFSNLLKVVQNVCRGTRT